MDKLHVFDVSPMIYAGGSHSDEYYGYPVGGIKYLMNRIAVAMVKDEDIVLCFDSPSFRSTGESNYKKGRIKRPPIISQLEAVYDGLSKCGIRCEKYAGYEADDIVEWAVATNYENYMYGTLIYGNDIDLCHSIRNGVQFITTNPAMNNISCANFISGIYKGKEIYYNTISAYKVFCGCSSDTIPPLKTAGGYNNYELYKKWCEVVSRCGPVSDRRVGANPEMVRIFAENSGLFTDEEVVDIKNRIKLIFPAPKPDDVVIIPTKAKEVDKIQLQYFLSLYNCTDALRCLRLQRLALSDNQKNYLTQRARNLKSGAYAADKNLEADISQSRAQLVDLDSFTKSF